MRRDRRRSAPRPVAKLAALLIVAASAGDGSAAEIETLAGDPAAGRRVALRSCAACHAIAVRDVWYTQFARGFPEIAQDPRLTEVELRQFLGTTHRMFWRSTDLSLQETADVIAYISSLKDR